MSDKLAFRRLGPGLTLVDRDALALRFAAMGLGDTKTLGAFMAGLGVGHIEAGDSVLYHWETLVIHLIEVLGRGSNVKVDGTHDNLTWDSAGPRGTERVFLCLLFDKAFDGELEPEAIVERVQEAERLRQEIVDVTRTANYGLGETGYGHGPCD